MGRRNRDERELRDRGRRALGPQCPVVQEGSPCSDRPFEADLVVTDRSGDEVATGRSGADGRFRIALEPGEYVVSTTNLEGILSSSPVDARVAPGRDAEVEIHVDSAIR